MTRTSWRKERDVASSEDFSKQVNSEMRAGRGVVVNFHREPEGHREVNAAIRSGAARGAVELDISTGQVTHRDGEPVEDRGGEGR